MGNRVFLQEQIITPQIITSFKEKDVPFGIGSNVCPFPQMRLALPACLSGLTCPDEVPVMVVKLQPPPRHLTSYNDRHLSLPSARLSLHQKGVQKLPYPSPTRWDPQKHYFPGGCPEALVTQSRRTGIFTRCGLCVREQLHSYETVHRARPRMSHMTKWGCLRNQGQLGKKPHCIHSPSFSSFHLFCFDSFLPTFLHLS